MNREVTDRVELPGSTELLWRHAAEYSERWRLGRSAAGGHKRRHHEMDAAGVALGLKHLEIPPPGGLGVPETSPDVIADLAVATPFQGSGFAAIVATSLADDRSSDGWNPYVASREGDKRERRS